MRRRFGIDILKHVAHRRLATVMQCTNGFRFALCSHHQIHHFCFGLLVTFIRPDAALDKMVLEPQDRIAERPCVAFGLRTIGGWIVRG